MITPPTPYPYQVEFFESEFDTHGMFLLSSSSKRASSGRFSRVVPNIFYVLIIVQIKISARHHQKGAALMRCALYANESIFGLLRNPQRTRFFF